jgi:2-polyprenyl-3-methyl-5-hydroxy-6-metoxy-1,4-benzoquinol methylase
MANNKDKENKQIEILSAPFKYSMAEEYHEYETPDHFWVGWRFDILKKVIPSGYEWGKVLDVGCGNCVARDQIEKFYGCTVDGCDVSLMALRLAMPGKGRLYFYNVEEKREEFREHFSTVAILDVLEHIKDQNKFLSALHFHIEPGGRLIVTVPGLPSMYSKYDAVAGHERRYTSFSLRREVEAAGFSVERIACWGMWLTPILALRKLLLFFCPREKVIKIGFQPQNLIVERILQGLRRLEVSVMPLPPVGASLICIARKY